MFIINTKDNFLHQVSAGETIQEHWHQVDDEKVQRAYGEEYLPYAPMCATCTLNAETQEWEISVDKEALQAILDEVAALAQAEEDARKAEEDARKAEEDARKAEISALSTRITTVQNKANTAHTAAVNAQNTANNVNANCNRAQILSSYWTINVGFAQSNGFAATGGPDDIIVTRGIAEYRFPNAGGSWALMNDVGIRGGATGVYKSIVWDTGTKRSQVQSMCNWCIRI